ncbi:hypothetical protein BHM03_00001964, partial [Ensete ventricosum]
RCAGEEKRSEEIWWVCHGEIRGRAADAFASGGPSGGSRGEFRRPVPELPLDRANREAALRRVADTQPRRAAVGGILVASVSEAVRGLRAPR